MYIYIIKEKKILKIKKKAIKKKKIFLIKDLAAFSCFVRQAYFMTDAVIRSARKMNHSVRLCWSRVSFSIFGEIFNFHKFPDLIQEVYHMVK